MDIKNLLAKIKKLKEKKIKINLRLFIPLLFIFILALFLYFYKGLFLAATVNGQPIWRLTLVKELDKQAGNRVLDSLITKTLILQEAKKQKVTVGEEEINQTIKEIQDTLAKQGQNLDQLLTLQGMTRDELKEQIKLQKIVEKIVGKEVSVTDKEVSDYLEKNKDVLPKDIKVDDVKKQLEQQKISEKANTWIEQLRSGAQINYFVQF